jgi:hypothetical protein
VVQGFAVWRLRGRRGSGSSVFEGLGELRVKRLWEKVQNLGLNFAV